MKKVALALFVFTLCGCDRDPVFEPAKWVAVDPGTYKMGSPATETCREPGGFKETLHSVTLTRGFEISAAETSRGQFEALMGYDPGSIVGKECGADCPVDQVSWHEAAAYCNALSRDKGHADCYSCTGSQHTTDCKEAGAYAGSKIYGCPGFRLPTEAEWEYACRAGTTTDLNNGQAVTKCKGYDVGANAVAWFGANSGSKMHKSSTKDANKWQIFDMSGSVWEWTNDFYQDDLGAGATTDPVGTSAGIGRVLRGGSAEVAAELVRSASRWKYGPPRERLKFQGFRCVRTLKAK